MTNLEIARIFSEIADILEIREENPFKVRAYRRVTQLLESLPQEVEEIYKRGELHNLPGVGASIAEKIKEIIETGKLKYHEELRKNIPAGLLEMLRIPEMGPKTVAVIYKKLGISTIEGLEKAAREKKLRNLYGLGPKTEENIIKGMSLIKKRKERIPLHEALVLAEDIIKRLKESGKVKRITYCGSVRRRKETIGDIDILATSSDPSQVMEVFTSLPLVKEVVAKGHTKSSILVGEGRQVDLRVVEEESFGAALHYFTGSKSHNIRVRELGVRKGLKINEYGVFVRKKEKDERIGGREEEEVFTYVDLPYIPPELREDWGEIEAAQKGRLPKLIELKEIKGDTHVHTRWSDGANTVREVVIAAREKGYEYIGICDHSQSLKVAGGVSKENFFQRIEEIRKIDQEITEVKVLAGAEVDILPDGSLDYPDELLRELDIVIASVHSKFKQDEDSM
ncbi:DNA polymerase/3'-5' exonuclease PolX, partial [Candidatus Calescamantes bacterium]|nr:DNA polymerase/3'-5' exonuclease PolX [Candidatus Calescamantes bacterium]